MGSHASGERGGEPFALGDSLESVLSLVEENHLGYHLGSAVMRIAEATRQGSRGAGALREARWLVERYVSLIDQDAGTADGTTAPVRRTEVAAMMRRLASALEAPSEQAGVAPGELERGEPADGDLEGGGGGEDPLAGRIRRVSLDLPA